MLANIRPLPGLYGGGFARVVQVEALPSGSSNGASQAAVRLERLKDPLASFRQSLAQFEQGQTVRTAQQPIDSGTLTLLQNIEPEQPLVPQARLQTDATLSAGKSEDDASYAIELARLERLRQEARAEETRKQQERADALRRFNEVQAPKQSYGPDPLAKLRQEIDSLSSELKLASLTYGDVGGTDPQTSTYAASLAAKAYASSVTSQAGTATAA